MNSNTKTTATTIASDDIYGEKWDRCLTDTLVKTASGLALGIVFSAVLFKRRPWPVLLGTGIGIGMGYSNCQNDFRYPYLQGRTPREKQTIPIPPVCLTSNNSSVLSQ
ncbi:unnamed protein product [Didymodactylos carnosus]|uniref:MICOS complex subunit MIC10 n=1 Tax=Didymodactylos carnosus TaxID=1234261 RepID=A0A815Z3W4_9BILA|nr:unnamed protein product [Didymodactylos carnosus]CAF1577672.1 unnamed protein product [Didymodactylos carnosus]CAF4090855.1 unnamed protein product [Didymodactylos carnosus]CAF4443638.1 unnamed protein product [Didymodactylos carnosus]